ncbi:MAG TPA: MOSC N-terminal beta barrel domain-containing protein [Pirellulales bacterium]|nr:MOSC N-terminal beta barrel domain-containing protein [Pirellulales bacterium]
MTLAYLSRINVYPFKSLDGQTVDRSGVLASGAMEHDRRFALFDAAGQLIDGKRTPAVHRLYCEFDPARRYVVLRPRPDGQPAGFQLDADRETLERWLADHFELAAPVRIQENPAGGFPDDTLSPGPTVISEATLATVAGWFAGVTVEEVRARFRPNLEIGGVPAFFEDRLYAACDVPVEFTIGPAVFAGVNPCQRCVVPSRWSLTGEVGPDPAFAKTFAQRRQETLPNWADRSRFDHYFRLATNTRLVRGGGATLTVGDEVRILGPRRAAEKPAA